MPFHLRQFCTCDGRVRGIKEEDTPTFLALVRNGLNVPEGLDLGGWGGRIVDFEDAIEADAGPGDPHPGMISVYRWRSAWQSEFQARFDWCVRDAKQANTPMVKLRVNRLDLDARLDDPDGDKITYEWLVYPPPEHPVSIETNGPTARVRLGRA